ncbi:hypothetical protein KC19_VG059300 [Ceratodon purpureus]|uniref:Uncharacterized protein n=1 Tax=Ceratodon purpureus TaxID=3225 RepID=A0A8T0HME3_CERPU|nr:hypothetical protein KC19_VG059300 [Ceratodon purpureus]
MVAPNANNCAMASLYAVTGMLGASNSSLQKSCCGVAESVLISYNEQGFLKVSQNICGKFQDDMVMFSSSTATSVTTTGTQFKGNFG